MNSLPITGSVSFVNHEKKTMIITYLENDKKKTVNGSFADKIQEKLKAAKKIKQIHQFHVGDTVQFQLNITDTGNRAQAAEIRFLYNNALDQLIHKARTENNFIGYLKLADDNFFVKEIDSYLFFPLQLSPWQLPFTEKELNEAVSFSLENLENPEKISARLYVNHYFPEYHSAVKAHKTAAVLEAKIDKITPHGIYLRLFGNVIQAKIAVADYTGPALKPGDMLPVRISYLSEKRIVVEWVP